MDRAQYRKFSATIYHRTQPASSKRSIVGHEWGRNGKDEEKRKKKEKKKLSAKMSVIDHEAGAF